MVVLLDAGPLGAMEDVLKETMNADEQSLGRGTASREVETQTLRLQ